MKNPDDERDVLRELIDDGTLVNIGGELYIQDTRRKKRGDTSSAEMLAGPLDGARLHVELDSTHVVAFIGAAWYVYARVGNLDRLRFIGSTTNRSGVDKIIDE
jgi:hypothetical protein